MSAQERELIAPRDRKQIGPGGRHLADLHQHAARLFERLTDTCRQRRRIGPVSRDAVHAREMKDLPVATHRANGVTDTSHRVAEVEQTRLLARRQRPHGRQEVEAESGDHGEQRAQQERQEDHLEPVPRPPGDDPRRDDAQGPTHKPGDRQRQPTATSAQEPARPDSYGHRRRKAEDDPSREQQGRLWQ